MTIFLKQLWWEIREIWRWMPDHIADACDSWVERMGPFIDNDKSRRAASEAMDRRRERRERGFPG